MNFFGDIYRFRRREDEDPDELAMRPENTMFVEYLPAGCFGPKMDQEKDIIGILDTTLGESAGRSRGLVLPGQTTRQGTWYRSCDDQQFDCPTLVKQPTPVLQDLCQI